MSGFYKYEAPFLLFGTSVLDANYTLQAETKDQNTYPIDGWHWFDNREEALEFFGVTEEDVQ